jgi:hypothetical protein
LLAAAAATACGSEPQREPAPTPPTPRAWPCALAADQGREHAFRMTLEQTLDTRAAGGPQALAALFAESPGALGDFAALASRRDPVHVDTIVTCPDAAFLLGRGLVTDLVLGLATAVDHGEVEDDGLRATVIRGAYADWSDGWQIHMTPPRDAFDDMRVLDTHADVWMSIEQRWVTIEVSMLARVRDDDRIVLAAPPLEAPVIDRGAPIHAGFRMVSATVDGARADLVLGAGGYLVVGGLGRGLSRIDLRYEGPLPLVGENQAERRLAELHRWLPYVPYAPPAPISVTVHHPATDALVAALPAASPPAVVAGAAGGTWHLQRFAGVSDRDPSLLLLDGKPARDTWDDGRGSRIELLASPPLPIDDCAPALQHAVEALAPLGPVGHVRVLAVPAVFGRHGRRSGDLVVLLRDKVVDLCTPVGPDSGLAANERRDGALELLVHELAHGWFGRAVRVADDEASAWYEAAAEYVSSWAVDEVGAGMLRRDWLEGYDDEAERDQLAMAQRVPTSGTLRDALSYDKGALLLTALEDVIGRDRMAAMLRHLIARRSGGVGSWLDVYTATQEVAGSQAAGWLQRWLFAVGAPELTVESLELDSGTARFAIAQEADPPFAATVGVGVFDGERLLAFARVPLSGKRTTVALDLPPGATRIAVDPFARLPRTGAAEVQLR